MSEAVATLDGWYCLHDFRQFDWQQWSKASVQERGSVKDELHKLIGDWQNLDEQRLGSFGLYEITGHKADFLMLNLRPTLSELTKIERDFDKSSCAQFFPKAHSYVSVVELGMYAGGDEAELRKNPHIHARLEPKLPEMQHVCFYPMSKRRDAEYNWYLLPFEKRKELMHSHGTIGRTFAGRLIQMICGSIGFEAWEWGVTLFANDPLMFKKVVYEMRFDEVSAKYGEFGDFYVGNRIGAGELINILDM